MLTMIRIGLIDDNEYEVDDIRTTIAVGWKKLPNPSDKVEFKLYQLSDTADFKNELFKELIDDVAHRSIQSLIVDYKLDTLHRVIEGKDVVAYMHETVPAFPVIILTNAPERSKCEDAIDPDKVYDKESFFMLETPQCEEMVFKIYRNISRYTSQRAKLETELAQALERLNADRALDTEEKIVLLTKITALEDELSQYTWTGQSRAEKAFDLGGLRELIAELIEIEEKL